MNPEFLRKLELAWKAMWVGDISRAYDILESFSPDEQVDPMLRNNIDFNLAVFSTLLNKDRAEYYRTKLENLYRVIAEYPSYPKPKDKKERRKTKEEKQERRQELLYRLKQLRIREMPLAEKLSFFISPREARRELNAAMKFAQGITVPEIWTVGRFRYSVGSDLSANIVRAYTDSELNLNLTKNLTSMTINYNEPDQEPDLISFTLHDGPTEIIARKNGVLLITRPVVFGENAKEVASHLISKLNGVYFPESLQ